MRVRSAWTGPAAPRLRLLPGTVHLDEVRDQADRTDRLLLGLGESDLAAVGLDPATEPHLLVLGDTGSGKSAVLRLLAQEIARTRTPAEAQILVVDYRRSLLGEVPEGHLLEHLTSAALAGPTLTEVATFLTRRLSEPTWKGADLYVLVDDYDLVATQHGSPVVALQPLLAQARDVGLHLLVARRSGGAARALYEPVLQSLRDLAAPALMLSGNPDDGPLIGSLRPARSIPGRGRLVTRDRGVEVVQTAWTDGAGGG